MSIALAALCAAPTATRAQTLIPDTPSCPTCRVEVSVVARLIGPDTTLAFPQSRVVEDSRGRYWTLPWGAPAIVFDARGSLAAVIKTTADPAGTPRYVREGAAVGDSVILLSADEAVVFDTNMNLVRVAMFPAKANMNASVMRWPDRVLLNGLGTSYGRAPFVFAQLTPPLFRIINAFGGEDATGRSLTHLGRIASPANDGRFWAADLANYRLKQWTLEGAPVRSLVRKAGWFPDFAGMDPTDIPSVLSVSEDERGRLWVLLSIPKTDARRIRSQAIARCPPPTPAQIPNADLRCPIAPWMVADPVLEVIDPATGSVVVHQALDRWIYQALPGGKFVSYSESGPSAHIEIVRLELKEP
jgi:hypothetical protein